MESILAIDIKNGLSKDGIIPWKSKADMQFFYNKTKNNVVVMGKNTYFSLPEKHRPLKNRLNIVLTSNPQKIKLNHHNDLIFTSDELIFNSILNNREKYTKLYPYLNVNFQIFFIGGKTIYNKFFPLCQTIWVTNINQDCDCDLFFDYDYSIHFKEEINYEDNEIQIIKYTIK